MLPGAGAWRSVDSMAGVTPVQLGLCRHPFCSPPRGPFVPVKWMEGKAELACIRSLTQTQTGGTLLWPGPANQRPSKEMNGGYNPASHRLPLAAPSPSDTGSASNPSPPPQACRLTFPSPIPSGPELQLVYLRDNLHDTGGPWKLTDCLDRTRPRGHSSQVKREGHLSGASYRPQLAPRSHRWLMKQDTPPLLLTETTQC